MKKPKKKTFIRSELWYKENGFVSGLNIFDFKTIKFHGEALNSQEHELFWTPPDLVNGFIQ